MGRGLIFHLCLILLVFASLADIIVKDKTVMSVYGDEPAMRSGFPYALTLLQFDIDEYPSGAPRDYVSRLRIQGLGGDDMERTVSVNRPVHLGFWRIYQMGYDVLPDGRPVSILECVKDPMWTLIAIGLWALMLYSLFYALRSVPRFHHRTMALASLFLFVVFVLYTLLRVGVGSGDLMPALRSLWFIPHIVAYMLAYGILTAVFIYSFFLWVRSLHKPFDKKSWPLLVAMTRVGFAFLGVGMAMGALWAKQSWGDWWSWDVKENWALVTWCGYALFLHLWFRVKPSWALCLQILSFLFLQMTWWGVNLLPSTGSLHVY